MKLPFVIYTDLECLLEKMSTCINNPNESSTTKIKNTHHRVIRYLLIAHSMNQKTNLIIIKAKIV